MKKFFKVLGLILLILLIAVVIIGMMNPEIKYNAEVVVNKPLKETFWKYNDPGTLKEWIPELKSVQIIDLKPGMIGSKLKMVIHNEGQTIELNEEITDYGENSHVGLVFEAGAMVKKNYVEFSEIESGTLIKGTFTCKGSNLFYNAMFTFFKKQFREIDQGYMNNFKHYAERS
ncbi:MAG: SRPBCC family protein [Bacteroidetes bacterium]|nr:MAG: SRPBCC family protein [Bacteroidota bacterium]